GNWRAFGHLPLKVDDPPKWHSDNLVGRDFQSSKVAFKVNHRAHPDGADIKVIWEPSRWFQLVRLALAGWLNHDKAAQERCIEWLHDWCRNNPPFTGVNWTSGLEVGIRLINYTWIDAFLTVAGVSQKALHELRTQILPPHTWYAWRYKSFGSSANNHLIGELAGLVVALARWPELAKISAPLPQIAKLLERETLLQFATDGCNEEQATGYGLFSWEFCYQSIRALEAANVPVSSEVKDRLTSAAHFYSTIKREDDPWEFGDCDNAWVTPLFLDERQAPREWHRWFSDSGKSPALRFWFGDSPKPQPTPKNQWRIFESGYATFESDDWFVRLDASPLGYLSMAPHGHLDALHLSISFRGQPVIVDPGTGAYYANKSVRDYLADWSAHNGPHLESSKQVYPRRFGTFLWGAHHNRPTLTQDSTLQVSAEIKLPAGTARRSITFLPHTNSFRIRDTFAHRGSNSHVITRWKFAPDYIIANPFANTFQVGCGASVIRLVLSSEWKAARTFNPPPEIRGKTSPTLEGLGNVPLSSIVSPAFRSLAAAPFLTLEGSGEGPFELTVSPG
ncbi:MAG TPA: heparinase II/III family protein, partial [Chthoniobacteraceae bacterium]|nr:heparinase II/III family protein [Chthoniobacteraceae bacterium]